MRDMQKLIDMLNIEKEKINSRIRAYTDKEKNNNTIFSIENKAMLEGRLLQINEIFKWIHEI